MFALSEFHLCILYLAMNDIPNIVNFPRTTNVRFIVRYVPYNYHLPRKLNAPGARLAPMTYSLAHVSMFDTEIVPQASFKYINLTFNDITTPRGLHSAFYTTREYSSHPEIFYITRANCWAQLVSLGYCRETHQPKSHLKSSQVSRLHAEGYLLVPGEESEE